MPDAFGPVIIQGQSGCESECFERPNQIFVAGYEMQGSAEIGIRINSNGRLMITDDNDQAVFRKCI